MSDVLHRFTCKECCNGPFYSFEESQVCSCGAEAVRVDACVTAGTTITYEGEVHDSLHTIDIDVEQEVETERTNRALVQAEKLRRGIDVESANTAS